LHGKAAISRRQKEETVAKIEARTEVTGAVWKIVTEVGQRVEGGDTIMIVESMKMEIPVITEEAGTVERFLVEEKTPVTEGQVVAILAS
jgi:acetyl-CoA carboxylase biotin carboxyl carrier protein